MYDDALGGDGGTEARIGGNRLLGVLGLATIVIATIFAYKTANQNGRSGPLWALLTATVGFGLQVAIPFLIGLILGIALVATGTPIEQVAETVNGIASVIGIILLFLSFVGMWLVLRHVAKLPEDEPGEINQPPPPPTFNQHDQQ